MKSIITLLVTFLTFTAHAQYPTNPTSDNIKSEAERLANSYSAQLALTGVQIPLFKNVVEDYLAKAENVKETMDGREELDALVELQARETLAMNDILTQPQYRLYKKLKFELQPLKIVESKKQ